MRSIISAGGACAFGQEDVGVAGAVEGVDGAGDDHRGEAGMELLGAADELVAVHLGHEEVAEQKVDAAGKRDVDQLESFVRGECAEDAVAAGFEQEGSDGEDLFVVINAEDSFLRAQCVLGSAAGRLLAGSRRMGQSASRPGWGRRRLVR